MPLALPPTGLAYTLDSLGNPVITWFPSLGATSYDLYRRTDTLAPYAGTLNSAPITSATYTDIAPLAGNLSYYTVTSVNGSGESLPSAGLFVDLTVGVGTPKVLLIPSYFDKLIDDQGLRVYWSRSLICPRELDSQKVTGTKGLDCPLCHNKSYIFFPPTEIKCLITSLRRHNELTPDGAYQLGTYNVTTKSTNKLGLYDKLTLVDGSAVFAESITKGPSNSKDLAKFPIVSVVLPIVDQNGTNYLAGRDFVISADGNIQWGVAGGSQPAPGDYYSLAYLTSWVLRPIDFPHDLRLANTQINASIPNYTPLATQALCKLDFYLL